MERKFLFLLSSLLFFSISAFSEEFKNAHVSLDTLQKDEVIKIRKGSTIMWIRYQGHDYIAYAEHLSSCPCLDPQYDNL